MATYYYDFAASTNGTGTPTSPFNTWPGISVVAGDSHLFKRGTTLHTAFTTVASVTYGAWFNSNGSDDTSQPRPIVITTSTFSTYSSINKNFVSINSWDIRALSLTVASDKSVIFMGTGATVNDCIIDTNVGAIGVYGKSNITITNNTIRAVSHTTGFTNNCVIVSDNFSMSNITISGNTVLHYGGGGANCFAMRVETTLTTGALTDLIVTNNTIGPVQQAQRLLPGYGIINETRNDVHQLPFYGLVNEGASVDAPPGAFYTINHQSIGLRLARCPGAEISYNTITGMLEGIFLVGAGAPTACHIHHNDCSYNLHFGIHLTTDTVGCLIEHNTCSYNGTPIYDGILIAYGRGIELSGAAGQDRCSAHIIRYNTCNYNLNYGGNTDNGSEGCGIGLDDSTTDCLVYGNTLIGNEGNGVQFYGGTIGSGSPTITDTGGNQVVANFFMNNCTASITNRRSGGTYKNMFNAHVGLNRITGTQSLVANNVFVGTTPCGVSQTVNCSNIVIANNIFIAVPHAISFGNTPSGTYNNDFFNCPQLYCSSAVDGNGEPTYPNISFTGVSDYLFDPMLDALYAPQENSPAIAAGLYLGPYFDFSGQPYKNPPTVGMYEFFGEFVPPTGEGEERSTRATGGGSGRLDTGYYALPDEFWETRAEMLSRYLKPNQAPYPRRRRRRQRKPQP